MDELMRWSVFRCQKKPFLSTIRLAHVYNNGNSALVVDSRDQVWRLKMKKNLMFKPPTRKLLTSVCDKEIIQFAKGEHHHLALSTHGSVYDLGVGTRDKSVEVLKEYRIVKIACGGGHSLALAADGKLLSWGRSEEGQCGRLRDYLHVPKIIHKEVVDMCAGENCSAFLTNGGHVYFCGERHNRPQFVTDFSINGFCVTKIQFSKDKFVALDDNGAVYRTDIHALLLDLLPPDRYTVPPRYRPSLTSKMKVRECDDKFVEIAACKYSTMVAARSCTGRVYVLARDGSEELAPVETVHHTLDAVFADKEMYRSMKVNIHSVDLTIRNSFNNPDQSDCKFLIDDQVIYAHKTILSLRSEYFRTMLSGDWEESKGEIRVRNRSFLAYSAFIEYLYTDTLTPRPVQDLLKLMELAHEFVHPDLLKLCVKKIRRNLCAENLCDVFVVARKLELMDLMKSCRDVASVNLVKILKTGSYARMSYEDAYQFTWFVSRNELKRRLEDGDGDGDDNDDDGDDNGDDDVVVDSDDTYVVNDDYSFGDESDIVVE